MFNEFNYTQNFGKLGLCGCPGTILDANNKIIGIQKTLNIFKFHKIDLINKDKLKDIFIKYKFTVVFNLAAQAGVRYSISNPFEYFESFLGVTLIF